MNWLAYTGTIVGVFLFMESVSWATHKYIMHGILWHLHEDHHKKGPGFFERNDTFFVIFATPSFFSILFGVMYHITWLHAVGFGVMAYGAAYFLVHDIIIHQRIKWFSRSGSTYIKTVRWAHKMHHKHLEKEDGESFGMLYVAKKYWDKVKRDREANAKLKTQRTKA